MKKYLAIGFCTLFTGLHICFAQTKAYTPRVEACPCTLYKADSSLQSKCGYLIVPENRKNPTGKTIKLPFVYVVSSNPNKQKDVVLYTAGGPGASSLSSAGWIHYTPLVKNRDFIAFEQRGTKNAIPFLGCPEVNEAKKTAYRKNLSKDSLVLAATARCRERLQLQGIDLSAYNTNESAADIADLKLSLKIDSINLIGISYSGGLMMNVMQNFPSGIRSVVLDSPLPTFVNYDEEGLLNVNEAFNKIFANCEKDSTDKNLYGHLKEKFIAYFSSIDNNVFRVSYLEKNTKDPLKINYSRNELLEVLTDKLSDNRSLKNIPYIITELIKGNHADYMTEFLNGVFSGTNNSSLGMRYSVWCTEQMPYEKESIINNQNIVLPYLAGYPFNNVNKALCKCWSVSPIADDVKRPVYSSIPVLLGAGDTDPWCRPLYNNIINHYMPNSQRLLFIDRTHAPLLNSREGFDAIQLFLDDPMKKVEGVKGKFENDNTGLH